MYNKMVIERFQNPKNAGAMHGANAIGQVGGIAGSDLMKLYLKINDSGKIEIAKFKVFGCCVSIAAMDVACDLIVGKDIENALKVTNKDILKVLCDVPDHKMQCLVLAEEAIRAAIQDYYDRVEKETKKSLKKAR